MLCCFSWSGFCGGGFVLGGFAHVVFLDSWFGVLVWRCGGLAWVWAGVCAVGDHKRSLAGEDGGGVGL